MEKLISWVEIPVLEMERAIRFYNAVLELDLQITDYGEEKMACFPNGEGALSLAPGFKPSKQGTLVSFNTGDVIQATIDRVIKAGGELLMPKTKIEAEGLGYFALFIDSEGNKLGLYGES